MTPTKRVLLVEDDDDDAFLSTRALRKAMAPLNINYDLEHVRTGKAAVERLFDKDKLRQPVFDLVLLDLMTPVMTGREALEVIRQHPEGWRIPVVVLTTSNHRSDVEAVWGSGVSAYLVKPILPDDYAEILGATGSLFLRHNHHS